MAEKATIGWWVGLGNDYIDRDAKGFDVMQGSAGDDRYYFYGELQHAGRPGYHFVCARRWQ
jgi:hypothetical protein